MNLATLEERDERSMDTFICEDGEESEDSKSEIENEEKRSENEHFIRALSINKSQTSKIMKNNLNLARNESKMFSGIGPNSNSFNSRSEVMNYSMQKDKRFSRSVSIPEGYSIVNTPDDANKTSHHEKLTGYLEKRSKMLGWRRFWFVLDGRLLTYYKSKADYESLGAFSGSINIGIASAVRPIQIRGCKGFPLQIATRSQVYYLRSHDKKNLERWLIAIQESATSPNPNFESDLFLRQESYSALSQWSLNYSTEDLSQIYYPSYEQKYANFSTSQPIKKCFSLASLPQKSDHISKGSQPLFARLVPHRQSNILFQKLNFDIESKGKSFEEESDESPPLLRKESEGQGRKKIRHSASMLVLNSSPAAGELRKELARKLSIGSAFPGLKPVGSERHSSEYNPSRRSTSSKTGRTSTNEIPRIRAAMGDQSEKGIYEPCGEPLSICTEESDIYENVEHFHPKNPKDSDKWEKTENGINENDGDSNENISQIRKNFSFRSIVEEPEKFNNIVETTNPLYKDEEAYFEKRESKMREESQKEMNFDMSRKNSVDSVLSTDSSMTKEGKRKWKSSIGGFFQKIFNKGGSEKSKKKDKNLVITSPMDLRRSQIGDELSPFSWPETSRNSSKGIKTPANDVVLDELKGRMSSIKRNSLELPNSDTRNEKSNWQIRRSNTFLGVSHQIIQENQNPQNNINRHNFDEKRGVSKEIFEKNVFEEEEKKESEGNNNNDHEEIDPDVKRTAKEIFLMKLEKFNKLSELYNAKDPQKRELLNCGRISSKNSLIKRSCSLSIQKVYLPEEPPLLPPKKRRSNSSSECPDLIPIYDFPQNNSLVNETESVTYEDIIYDNHSKSLESISKPNNAINTRKSSSPEIMVQNFELKIATNVYQNTDEILKPAIGNSENVEEIEMPSNPPPPPPRPKRLNSKKQKQIENEKSPQHSSDENDCNLDECEAFEKSTIQFEQIESKEKENQTFEESDKMNTIKNQEKRESIICIPVIETLGDESELAETFELVENIYDDVYECKFEPDIENMNQDNERDFMLGSEPVERDLEELFSEQSKIELNGEAKTSDGNSVSSSETITQEDCDRSNEEELPFDNQEENGIKEAIYENVKFANSEIIVEELETVSEIEDEEMAELYDDFPFHLAEKEMNEEENLKEEARAVSVRHSGIDQLKAFLNFEILDNEEKTGLAEASSMRHGAISRLGHSSAVTQLQKIIQCGSTNT